MTRFAQVDLHQENCPTQNGKSTPPLRNMEKEIQCYFAFINLDGYGLAFLFYGGRRRAFLQYKTIEFERFFFKRVFFSFLLSLMLKEKDSNNDILYQESLDQSICLKQNFMAKLWTCKQNLNYCDRSWL